jgi:hypothetical protein
MEEQNNLDELDELDELDDAEESEDFEESVEDTGKGKKKGKKGKKNKEKDAGRGIETMFRTSLRNHIQLSQIADSKANIMLTINGGILAFSLGSLFPRFNVNPVLVLPSCILAAVCVTALIFAVISTIPKVTRGTYTREEIQNKQANLLFFGNFYKMNLEEFEWGINEMIKDRDYLYGSMIRDFYNLGKVLSVKYKYLRISYMIFMIGMVFSVLVFVTAFVFNITL